MKILKKISVIFLGFMIVVMTLQHTAEATEKLELRVKVGSNEAIVNGVTQTIVKPYQVHGVTMVPLGVFKKAFGAEVRLEDDNAVKLTMGQHTVNLTTGSPVIWVDGVKVKSNAAPAMFQNTLMVPLRLVANGIGAKLLSGNGGDILVQLQPEEPDESDEDGEDSGSDVHKTRIGNSYYGWTISYPTELIPGNSGDESVATFSDNEDTYYLEVHAGLKVETAPDMDTLMDLLVTSAKNSGEIVIDQSSFPQAKVPYARIVTSDKDGALWEGRAYYGGGRLFTLYLSSETAKTYKDLNSYGTLLDSFQPSFDPKDKTIRDLSKVKNDKIEVYNDDYGISLQVPADWNVDNSRMIYTGKNGESLGIYVSSAPSGLTLDSWSDQLQQQDKSKFLPESYQFKGRVASETAGEKALIQEIEFNFGNGWTPAKRALIISGGYRYLLDYTAPKGTETGQGLFRDILSTLDIDFKGNTAIFGNLDNRRFLLDTSKSALKASNNYRYTIAIPLYWTAVNERYEQSQAEYEFTGGSFKLETAPSGDPDLSVWQLKSYYNEMARSTKGFELEGVDQVTLAGVPATVFRIHQIQDGVGQSKQQILFSKDGSTYKITTTLNDATSTAQQKAALQKAVQSFAWMK